MCLLKVYFLKQTRLYAGKYSFFHVFEREYSIEKKSRVPINSVRKTAGTLVVLYLYDPLHFSLLLLSKPIINFLSLLPSTKPQVVSKAASRKGMTEKNSLSKGGDTLLPIHQALLLFCRFLCDHISPTTKHFSTWSLMISRIIIADSAPLVYALLLDFGQVLATLFV